jgi:hypothetical protein
MPASQNNAPKSGPTVGHNPHSRLNRLVIKLAERTPLIIGLYVASLALATWLYSLAEHISLSDGYEWAYQTALTVGYGDFPPHTFLGRQLSSVFGHMWVWGVVPLIIANIIVRVLYDKNQYTHQEQEWVATALVLIADANGITLPPRPAATDQGDLDADEKLM